MGINRLFSNEGPDYSTCDFLPDKPCSYYIPKQKISCFHSPEYEDPDIRVDQVLISNSSQCMMLLEVFMNTKKPMLSMKLHKLFNQPTLFSKFSMEPIGASEVDYEITYMNEYGIIDSKLATLVPKSNENSGFSMKITEDNGSLVNSFPMFDFKIVQSSKPRYVNNCSSQEFWCVSRSGRKGALMNLRTGYSGFTSDTQEHMEDYKHVSEIFGVDFNGDFYFILSFPNESKLITFETYQKLPDDVLEDEVSDEFYQDLDFSERVKELPQFSRNSRTLLFGKLSDSVFLQVFENSWRVADMFDTEDVLDYVFPAQIMMASFAVNYLAIGCQLNSDNGFVPSVQIFFFNGADYSVVSPVNSALINQKPAEVSLIRFHEIEDRY
ncbi:unnamed protein product [Ambrosiozyma monospora]|uniref:Unnamed protein product n=1 Tax=Ambrosiozyma monospora TaxID=43982 RepID=A0ACB5TKD6_AMBMO|nr:unnamed protein product [Ambrosiozyma monospora]